MPEETIDPPEGRRLQAPDVYSPPALTAFPDDAPQDAQRGTPWTLTTYFAEGLPFSIVHQVAPVMFTAMHASLAAVGYTSLYGLAWNFKFLWSPLLDRYGTLRRWVVLCELLLSAVLLVIAWRAGQGDLFAVAVALIPISFLAATHDVAVDGYYIAALDKPAQAALSGARVGAYRVALLVGKSGLVMIAGFTRSWFLCFAAAALLMGGLGAFHRFALRPLRGGVLPAKPGPKAALVDFVGSFRTFLAKPRIAVTLAFIVAFKAGDALLFNMSPPFFASLGFDTDMQGVLSAPSLVASVAGTLVGGVAIRRFSLRSTLLPIAFLQTIAIPLYTALALLRPSFWVLALVVSIEQLVAGVGNAALIVFLMRRSDGPHKTAHFAICTALMSLPVTLVGLWSGNLAHAVGFAKFFAIAFLVAVPGVFLARAVPKD